MKRVELSKPGKVHIIVFLQAWFSLTCFFAIGQQGERKFRNHEEIEIGGGQKVEILRCRGEGPLEECDVIYFTVRRQDGTRMWQNANRLRDEERAFLLAGQQQIAGSGKAKSSATAGGNNASAPKNMAIKKESPLNESTLKVIIESQKQNVPVRKSVGAPIATSDASIQVLQKEAKRLDSIELSKVDTFKVAIQKELERLDSIEKANDQNTVIGVQKENVSDTSDNAVGHNLTSGSAGNKQATVSTPTATSTTEKELPMQDGLGNSGKVSGDARTETSRVAPTGKSLFTSSEKASTGAADGGLTKIVEKEAPDVATKAHENVGKQPVNYTTSPAANSASIYATVPSPGEGLKANLQAEVRRLDSISKSKVDTFQLAIRKEIDRLDSIDKAADALSSKIAKNETAVGLVDDESTKTGVVKAIDSTNPAIEKVDQKEAGGRNSLSNKNAPGIPNKILQKADTVKRAPVPAHAERSVATPATPDKFIITAEVNKRGIWEKAIVIDKESEYLYKVHFNAKDSKEDEWVHVSQLRNIDSTKKISEPVKERKTDVACSFKAPGPPVSDAYKFSNNLAKRKIYESYQTGPTKAGSTKIGVAFVAFDANEPFVNTVSVLPTQQMELKFASAPAGAMVYPVKATLKVCERSPGKTTSKIVDSNYACFRNRQGAWACTVSQ